MHCKCVDSTSQFKNKTSKTFERVKHLYPKLARALLLAEVFISRSILRRGYLSKAGPWISNDAIEAASVNLHQWEVYTFLQSQEAVSAYLQIEQILFFGPVWQYTVPHRQTRVTGCWRWPSYHCLSLLAHSHIQDRHEFIQPPIYQTRASILEAFDLDFSQECWFFCGRLSSRPIRCLRSGLIIWRLRLDILMTAGVRCTDKQLVIARIYGHNYFLAFFALISTPSCNITMYHDIILSVRRDCSETQKKSN